jgi:hypothetical protein
MLEPRLLAAAVLLLFVAPALPARLGAQVAVVVNRANPADSSDPLR